MNTENKIMRRIQWGAGYVMAFSLLLAVFFTSFQIAVYGDMDWFRRTYEKYEVLNDLDMTMDDVMYVTHELMDYLIDRRDDLVVYTTIGGETKDFFGERERFHMAKVKDLFLGGLQLRTIGLVLFAISFIFILVTNADYKKILPKTFWISLGITAVASVIMGVIVYFNFEEAFLIFHEFFFEDECWVFNPRYSYMIRMLPEGLFNDMALRVLGIFGIFIALLLAMSIIMNRNFKKMDASKNAGEVAQ